ncbi:hypothetical protein DSM100238_1247 [Bifidobacterium apri]|uniref:Uncharacterized protein n=1 Tax=Bifidobacterium apri TaxID=1769423 RepID=A0A6A2W180_9BIFI|nr:hypothetical protein DSM100238_1247 [Bifidobacterium apri]
MGNRRRTLGLAIGATLIVICVMVALIFVHYSKIDDHAAQPTPGSTQSSATTPQPSGPPTSTKMAKSLNEAYQACDKGVAFDETATTTEALVLEDGGKSLTVFSGNASDFSTFTCVANHLNIPANYTAEMLKKQDNPSMVSISWDGYSAQWTYNTRSGLDLYITSKD